jgi:hypothetical protein
VLPGVLIITLHGFIRGSRARNDLAAASGIDSTLGDYSYEEVRGEVGAIT